MDKLENWWERLSEYLHESKDREFKWGEFDCCVLAAKAGEALVGVDFLAEFGLKYYDMRSAHLVISRFTGLRNYNKGIIKIVESMALKYDGFIVDGAPSRGDVVVIDYDGLSTCGICIGPKIAMIRQYGGMTYIPTKFCEFKTIVRFN